jgi:hypothetical protein
LKILMPKALKPVHWSTMRCRYLSIPETINI